MKAAGMISILALTVSSLRSGGRPSHGRSWLFFAFASIALLFRAVEKGGRGRWIAYALVTGLSLYSHYFAILMLPVHLAYLLINRVPWRKFLA